MKEMGFYCSNFKETYNKIPADAVVYPGHSNSWGEGINSVSSIGEMDAASSG